MFFCKTKHATKVKAFFELVFNNLKTACLTIDSTGIHLKSKTTLDLMIETCMPADQFDEYVYSPDSPMHIGVESYIGKSLKTMKNKTVVTLAIKNPGTLSIGVSSTGKDKFTYNLDVVIESVQNVSHTPNTLYDVDRSTRLSTARFIDACKLVKSASAQEFTVTRENSVIKIAVGTQGVISEQFCFGKEDVTDTELVHYVFKSERMTRVSKMVSFTKDNNKVIDVFVESGKPMMLQCVSEIGTIKVYFLLA